MYMVQMSSFSPLGDFISPFSPPKKGKLQFIPHLSTIFANIWSLGFFIHKVYK